MPALPQLSGVKLSRPVTRPADLVFGPKNREALVSADPPAAWCSAACCVPPPVGRSAVGPATGPLTVVNLQRRRNGRAYFAAVGWKLRVAVRRACCSVAVLLQLLVSLPFRSGALDPEQGAELAGHCLLRFWASPDDHLSSGC